MRVVPAGRGLVHVLGPSGWHCVRPEAPAHGQRETEIAR